MRKGNGPRGMKRREEAYRKKMEKERAILLPRIRGIRVSGREEKRKRGKKEGRTLLSSSARGEEEGPQFLGPGGKKVPGPSYLRMGKEGGINEGLPSYQWLKKK